MISGVFWVGFFLFWKFVVNQRCSSAVADESMDSVQ